MKDRTGKQVDELQNVLVRDMILKMAAVLGPRRLPQSFEVTSRERWNGVPAMPLDEGLLERLPDLFLRQEDLVLKRTRCNRRQRRRVKAQGIAVEVDVMSIGG